MSDTSQPTASNVEHANVNVRWIKNSHIKPHADQGRGRVDPTDRPTGARAALAGDAAAVGSNKSIFRAGNSPRMNIQT